MDLEHICKEEDSHREVSVKLEVNVCILSQSYQWLTAGWSRGKCVAKIESSLSDGALDPNRTDVRIGGVEGTSGCRGKSKHR